MIYYETRIYYTMMFCNASEHTIILMLWYNVTVYNMI